MIPPLKEYEAFRKKYENGERFTDLLIALYEFVFQSDKVKWKNENDKIKFEILYKKYLTKCIKASKNISKKKNNLYTHSRK